MSRRFVKNVVFGLLAVAAIGALAAPSAQAGWVFVPGRGLVFVPDCPANLAMLRGMQEGRNNFQFGLVPNHPMSPAEQAGFLAGQGQAASVPWQLNPVRQQGWQEWQLYQRYGLVPNHPMSPAEQAGFLAGQQQAIYGW
jgi:hypothetical protein